VSSSCDSDAPGASSPPPSLDDVLAAAVANAALEGIRVELDEQDLIRKHQRGELTREEFLAAAQALAEAKADPGHV
jgi:hypothetical protein